MRASSLLVASLPLLVSAHSHNARHNARQAGTSSIVTTSSSSSGSVSAAAATPAPPASPPASPPPAGTAPPVGTGTSTGGVVANTTSFTTFPSVAITLLSTNPTAIPTASITAGEPPQQTHPLPQTFAAGSQPSAVPGAPSLPSIAGLNPALYPPLDRPPPTDSPQVQQWIQEVQNSGVTVPGFSPTVTGGCPANLAAANDPTRCWWTCGGCTRDTDVSTCPDKMTWGLTYDDGPAVYTPDLLTYLDSQNLKATFFVIGSRAISQPAMLQYEYMTGHQIAVHTWSHFPLTTLTTEQIIAELGWSRKIIKDIIGVTPNMMRPPFGDIDDRVRAISVAMGLTPVMWTRISPLATFDTDDFNVAGDITSVGQVLQNWQNILGNATQMNTGFIVLEHDLFQQAVDIATGYILPDALAHKPPFKIEPVISCLNKPMTDAYVETNDNKTSPPPKQSGAGVTLSSGAPGSAQATGSSGKSSAPQSASVDRFGSLMVGLAGLLGAAAVAF